MPTDLDVQTAFKLLLTPERPAVIFGRPTKVKVLVRVQAPPVPADTAQLSQDVGLAGQLTVPSDPSPPFVTVMVCVCDVVSPRTA